MSSHPAKITIIMPIYNGSRSLLHTLASLEAQQRPSLVEQLILINDGSRDNSGKVITEYAKASRFKTKVIQHDQPHGLSATYNEGIAQTRTDILVTMHQDIRLVGADAFERIINAFAANAQIAAVYPTIRHPLALWQQYSFWQQCLFGRYVQRQSAALTGKFDGFRVAALDDLGGFDAEHYRTAGEDADIRARLATRGYLCTESGVIIDHAEEPNPQFGLRHWLRKEAQYAEARGVILRRHGFPGPKAFAATFFREILFLGLLIPFVWYPAALLTLAYAFTYTSLVVKYRGLGLRTAALPFINIGLLPFNALYSLKAFILNRETI